MDNTPTPTPAPIPENAQNAPQAGDPTLYSLMDRVLASGADVKDKIKLIDELRKNNAPSADRWAYRTAIWILGVIILGSIGLIGTLSIMQRDISEGLISIGSTAVGGLAGLLSQPRENGKRQQQE